MALGKAASGQLPSLYHQPIHSTREDSRADRGGCRSVAGWNKALDTNATAKPFAFPSYCPASYSAISPTTSGSGQPIPMGYTSRSVSRAGSDTAEKLPKFRRCCVPHPRRGGPRRQWRQYGSNLKLRAPPTVAATPPTQPSIIALATPSFASNILPIQGPRSSRVSGLSSPPLTSASYGTSPPGPGASRMRVTSSS